MLYNFYTLHYRMEKIPAMQTFRIRRVLRARFIFHRTFVFVVSPAAHTISPYPARLKIYVADRPKFRFIFAADRVGTIFIKIRPCFCKWF